MIVSALAMTAILSMSSAVPVQGSSGMRPGLYKPREDLWLNDPRIVLVDGVYHLYLQQPPREIRHAVSKDLVSWAWQPGGISRGPAGSWDDKDICTSGFFYWQGVFYALYTGRCNAEDGRVQRIGLATSTDGRRFKRHAKNPVLVADPRWYETDYRESPGYGNVAWRDPAILHNPTDGWFYAYITGRLNKGPGQKRGCIAVARSRNLIDWECLPPCYAPGLEQYHEVPQLLEWEDGRYVLFFGCKRGGFTHMRYIFGTDPLRFDSTDPGRLFLGSPVMRSGRGIEYSSWVVPRGAGLDVIHLVYEWQSGALHRGRISLPKRLNGTPETGLVLTLRDDLKPRAQDVIDLRELRPPDRWRVARDQIVATPEGPLTVLALPGTGARTLSVHLSLSPGGTAGVALDHRPNGDSALRVLLTNDGQITTRTHTISTRQKWNVGKRSGVLAVTAVGKHIGIYFNGRFLGNACAAKEPSPDRLSLVCSGQATCTFGGLAQRTLPMSHVYARE